MAPADQTTDPNEISADTEALVRRLGVAAGHRLDGRYRLDRVLHPTGPALTWLATDEKLNRPTRVHILRSDEPRAQAFMEAARAAAAMPDNHFVQVLDAVPDDGLFYVITEWLHDGHTLGEVLARGPLPVPEAIRITSELARAMSEAHDAGLAHLRLSPKTVLRTDTGEVKILDLCLAAALTGTVSRDPLGTDLAAIGELAYAMLTGKRPGTDPVPPSQLRPEVTPQLDEVVLRTLGDPTGGEAYQTPVEVSDALAKLPRPRYESPMPSTAQTAPLRHQQTQVMSPAQRPPGYEPTPQAYQAPRAAAPVASHGGHASHAAGGSGGGHRVSSYDEVGHGGSGSDNKNLKIGLGAVAVVAAIAVGAWAMMGNGSKAKTGSGSAGGTSSQQSSSTTSAGPVGGPIKPVNAVVYDADDGTEGKAGAASLIGGTGKWQSNSYCAATPTHDGKTKAGTGVVFDLGAQKQIVSVSVTVLTPGASVEMMVGGASVTGMPAIVPNAAPAGFTSMAKATADSTTVTLTPTTAATGQYVLIWFNTLAAEPTPNPNIKCAKSDGKTYGDSITGVTFNGP